MFLNPLVCELNVRSSGRRETGWNRSTPADIDAAFATLTERKPSVLLSGPDQFYGGRIQQLVAQHRIPAMHCRREFAEAGGLASYGASVIDACRLAGSCAARILKGEQPGELPVMQSDKYEFVLNLKTAKALGLDVPMRFPAAADEIIEESRAWRGVFSGSMENVRKVCPALRPRAEDDALTGPR